MTDALAAVGAQRVLPVITVEDERTATDLGRALSSAGARVVEVTFRSDAAAAAIEALAEAGFVVGAGTVRTVEQVELAAQSGAAFAVSPGLDPAVVERCQEVGLTPMPGVATASELGAALALGVDVVKLFPAEVLGGPACVRALSAPFPDARFVPTGGLNLGNAAAYLELPQVFAIGGSWMVAPALIAAGDWAEVERLTAESLRL
jgi:2-dehydro-3-deoxyphosphogluconate aldolase/(4S)-4-hydroxy-2-oxoglutarate aldolase